MDKHDRFMTVMFGIAVLWILFLVGAGGTMVWLLGRWLGVW